MSKIKNRSTAILLSFILLFTTLIQPLQALQSSGQDEKGDDGVSPQSYGIQPLWENARTFSVTLDCSGTYIEIDVSATAQLGTTYRYGYVKLEKLSGYNIGLVKEWQLLSSSTNIFGFSDNSIKAETGKYKLTAKVQAVRFGVVDKLEDTREDTH